MSPRNGEGQVKDVTLKVREVLDAAESEFQDYMTSMIEVLKEGVHSPRSPEQNHQVIMDTVLGSKGLPLPDTPDLDYSIVDTEIVTRDTYCFWGYSLFQAIWLEGNGAITCNKNDLEDGQLCAYVPLDEEVWVVAGDEKLRSRLEETRDLLTAVGLGTRAQFHPVTPDALTHGEPT